MKTFVARQPIFNADNETIAYELLFRSLDESQANVIDGNDATEEVLKNLLVDFGSEKLSSGKKLFINFTEDLILNKIPLLVDKNILVIEVLEDVVDSPELLKAVKELKDEGYTLAIDDFIYSKNKEGLINLVDIIKIDFRDYSLEEISETVKKVKTSSNILLAEKIETSDEAKNARELGFELFQGYYYLEPEIIEGRTIASVPSVYLRLIEEINKSEIDYIKLAEIIKTDTALAYSFLNIVNSVAYYSRRKITSIKDAITRLGIKEGRKIIYFNFLKTMKPDESPDELLKKSLIRGKQCELLAKPFGMTDEKENLFLIGLFSLINIILKTNMKTITDKLPLDEKVKQVLLGKRNRYSKVIDLIIMNEKNRANLMEEILEKNNISVEVFSDSYFDSIEWADQIFN